MHPHLSHSQLLPPHKSSSTVARPSTALFPEDETDSDVESVVAFSSDSNEDDGDLNKDDDDDLDDDASISLSEDDNLDEDGDTSDSDDKDKEDTMETGRID